MPQSLRGLTIAFLALFLATTMLAGIGIYQATLSRLDSLVDARIEDESFEIAPPGVPLGRGELIRRIRSVATRRDTASLGLLLTDADGRKIAGNTTMSHRPPLGFSSLDSDDDIDGVTAGRVLRRRIGGGMDLSVFAETEPYDNYLTARRNIYGAGFGAIVLVVLGGVLLFRQILGRRIDAMRRTADSIIKGDLSRRVPVLGHGDEFDQQAAALNRMLDRIAQLMGEVRNVSNDISHEMRTPLARLRNALSLLEQRAEAEPIRSELQLAREQADDLLAMFAAMLRIAEIETGARRAGFYRLDLAALCEEIAEIARPLAAERGQQVLTPEDDGAEVSLTGDRQLLSQLLLNLVENALRHSGPGTSVSLGAERRGDRVVVTVCDDGPGILEAQRVLVMRRFGRLERSHGEAGHGLGLPLADAIARLHHGTMRLDDAAPGLRITIELPD